MNRRDFIKTVAVSSVALALPSVPNAAVAKTKILDTDISAAKKIKDGYLSTGHEALDKALGGGIPYHSHVLIAGPPGSGKATLLDSIYKANEPEWYSKDPGHIIKLETPVAYVRHNIGPSRDPKLPEKYWSFMLVDPFDMTKSRYSGPFNHTRNSKSGPLAAMDKIKAEGHFKNMTVIELMQTPREGFIGRNYADLEYIGFERTHSKVLYSDIVIRVTREHYRIVKNSSYCSQLIPKV